MSSSVRAETYLAKALPCVPRLLNLLDRAGYSGTSGSFDRAFWWNRKSDFSSAIHQQAVLSLALLFTLREKENDYFSHPLIASLAESSLLYGIGLQNADGSYDEWYPGEKGWAGPTAYILYAQARACRLMQKEFSSETIEKFKASARKAVNHLDKFMEGHHLANHEILACLAVKECEYFFADSEFVHITEKLWAHFMKSHRVEGWSLEYDGADAGYQTATLSFLARLHRLGFKAGDIESIVEKQLDFISHFCYPNFEFSGCVGSRNTTTIFHFSFEYWARLFPQAESLSAWARVGLNTSSLRSPGDHEDHYFIYRLHEFLEAYEVAKEHCRIDEQMVPFLSGGNFVRRFEEAGVICVKSGRIYCVVQLKKCGVLRAFDIQTGQELAYDSGWLLQIAGRHYSNAAFSSPSIESEESIFRISGFASRLKSPVFNRFSFILFRLSLSLFSLSGGLAVFFKNKIRNFMMYSSRVKGFAFERAIYIGKNSIEIHDKIFVTQGQAVKASLRFTDLVKGRYVPQSGYFEKSELQRALEVYSGDALMKHYDGKALLFVRKFPVCAD